MRSLPSIIILAISIGLIATPLTASAQVMVTTPGTSNSNSPESFAQFTPTPQKSTQIGYDIWDSLLEEMVLYSGPSARKRMSRPQPITGSRFARGHLSAYRLEGNRIPYSQITSEFEQYITDYRKDLERIGTQTDIAKLSKNEQLAFWLNLHNVAMVEQLAKAYPLKEPRSKKIGSLRILLNDVKIVTVKNTNLSLRDIREKIVYPN